MREIKLKALEAVSAGVNMGEVWKQAASDAGSAAGLGVLAGSAFGPGGILVGGLIGFGVGTLGGTYKAIVTMQR